MSATPILVLASASPARRTLFSAAGLTFILCPAAVDEAAVKRHARELGLAPHEAASRLADAKVAAVAAPEPSALVIGADQILSCDDAWFDKPSDRSGALNHLRTLSGRTHLLHTAVSIRDADGISWRHVSSPRLRMRRLDETEIAAYVDAEGEAVLGSVGAYLLESRGRTLFETIDGEHSAILGLPMPPLLIELRRRGVPIC